LGVGIAVCIGGKMSRVGLLNYRKLAFDMYAPICVHCGFGIQAVLQVAHLDCNPENCGVENLVILCPTCHRMHDIDLIPTDVVVRLRDEKRKPRWAKLMKDAGAKAVATKRQTPDLLRQAAQKAAATRRARKIARSGDA
jgi:5-methylcytosine-specific restriction endonuclease McrA